MEIVFIRHGETSDNIIGQVCDQKTDYTVGLTERGVQQALDVKELLKDEAFDAVYASDMLRTKQTAQYIFPDKNIIFTDVLREGAVSYTLNAVYNYKTMPKEEWYNQRLLGFTDGEPYAQQVERIESFLHSLVPLVNTHKKIAVITHNGCLRTLYYLSKKMSMEETLKIDRTDNCGIIRAILDANGNITLPV